MSDDFLIAELRALSAELDVPDPADQRAAVRARLTGSMPHPRRSAPRTRWSSPAMRWLAALLATLVGAVIAVTPARAAVLAAVDGVLRIVGIEVRADSDPAPLPVRPSPLPATGAVTLAAAKGAARFPVRVPGALGVPEKVELADPAPGGEPRVVTMAFRGGAVRFDQFDGRIAPAFLKMSGAAEWTEVGGDAAIWVPGPHAVTYVDRAGAERTETGRLAAPTLIWSSDGVTYRLEGLATVAEARTVASDLR
ncbi:hypothetical protein [Actinoplanes sp. NPDC051859]|uniref:hypothetical protein n=1 Tax=Actinoplanes sp. NPDC051859 TaxID=3363909 RepID=UPI00379C9170